MEGQNSGKDRLIVPTEFAFPPAAWTMEDDLLPPSHFLSSAKPAGAAGDVQTAEKPPADPWLKQNVTPVPPALDLGPASPWAIISQAQQEILELRKENQRLMKSQEAAARGRAAADPPSDFRTRSAEGGERWSRLEQEWRVEVEKHKSEAGRLKGQVDALKEAAERCRLEARDRDVTLTRQAHDLETVRQELCKAKGENRRLREELALSSLQNEKTSAQLERLKRESEAEAATMRGDFEKSKEEARELRLQVERQRRRAEEEARRRRCAASEQLEELRKRQEGELLQLSASRCAEMEGARKSNAELRSELESATQEAVRLQRGLAEAGAERDELGGRLSQMRHAFETQSQTLHSLRNYIGRLVPERGETERLNEAVERLNEEKAALQKTAELLTVRLNSANEILLLQEEEVLKKTDPLVRKGSEGLHVLQLWRQKVFKLCVQLRSKDAELRDERAALLSRVELAELQLREEQQRAALLQHALDAGVAELDQERLEKETLKRQLAQAHKDGTLVESRRRTAETGLEAATEAVQRFSLAFQSKAAEVDAAQAKLGALSQRLRFAQRRAETLQGLMMRRAALQKAQQAGKQTQQDADRIGTLETELILAREERERLTRELKRTPELVESALADLKEQHESELRRRRQEAERSRSEAARAAAAAEEDRRRLQRVQAQLEESEAEREKLGGQLLGQRERGEKALREGVSEAEKRCAEKLDDMAAQVAAAKREHAKAVMALQHVEREAARKSGAAAVQTETEKDVPDPRRPERPPGWELMSQFTPSPPPAAAAAAAPWKQPDWIRSAEATLAAHERLFSAVDELQPLAAAALRIGSEDEGGADGRAGGRTWK